MRCWRATGTATGKPSPSWSSATSGRSTTPRCGSLRNAEDARDVTQIVFLRVAERLDEYDSQYKFFSWIYRIAVNESLNLLRRNGREEELDDEAESRRATARTRNGSSARRSSRGTSITP